MIIWVPLVLPRKNIYRNDLSKIEHIGEVMCQFDLNYEEAQLINRVEGWDYAKVVGEKLSQDKLKWTELSDPYH